MKDSINKSADLILLRKRAEQLYKKKQSEKTEDHSVMANSSRSDPDTMKLLAELEVRQIELELMNEELQIAKENAEKKSKKYSTLYNFAPFGYFTLDYKCCICELNFKGARMLGKDRSKLLKSNFKLFITPDNHADFTIFYDKVYETKTLQSCEVSFSVDEKLTIYVYIEGVFSDVDGNCFLTVVDITERKQTEKALVENLRMRTIGEMSSSIAHDFNNSLQGMMGNLEIVRLQDDLSIKTLTRMNSIGSILTDMASRVRKLQNFENMEHQTKKSEYVSLNKIIEVSLEQSRHFWKGSMDKKGLKVSITKVFDENPMINCKKGELRSAIYNLIKNSVEAMPNGGDITFETGIKPEGVFVSCTDTGTGMDKESQLRIFQPFYTTKGFDSGRGLGMSGVYSIVKNNKGDITVKSSELGKGTTIEIVFPVGQQDETGDIISNVSETKEKNIFRVLWVDDDERIGERASYLVELIGHSCAHIVSGKRALEYLGENPCDIVVTDIGMPNMNGWELADAIRDKFGDKIKIVVASGWDINDKTRNEHDINHILQKPFTAAELEKVFLVL